MANSKTAASSEPIEPWAEAWLNSHKNPWLFATGVLGFLPYDPELELLSPEAFLEKYGPDAVMLEKWQDDFLRPEYFFTDPDGRPTDNPRHSIRAGHGVGKGVVLAILALWHPLTHYDAKCVLTANSQDQLKTNNWPEIRKWARRLPEPLYQQIQIDEETLYVKAQPEMAFVVRRTASKHNPEALQGIHAKHVLYLVDEASGIFDLVFEIAQGSLSTRGAIAILTSNPTRTTGFFADTHRRLRNIWKCMRVSCEDVPRARGHIQEVIDTYGKDSNRYRVRVLGEFPTKDDDTVIPLEDIESAKGRKVEISSVFPVWGLDIARFGDDRTVLTKRQGNTLIEPPIIWRNLRTTEIAGRVIDEFRRTPNDFKPAEVCIDVLNMGAGVVDILEEHGSPLRGRITAINVTETKGISHLNYRMRDELWWRGREWFEAKDCCIPVKGCEDLISELSTPTYTFTSSGQRVVMRKDEMKKELGFSPDIADSFLLTLAAGTYPREPDRHRRFNHRPRNTDPWSA